ncbi:MAG: hypothetical protein IJH75_00785 [Mogibacterium sp.]|nr:hypothetical protein [Mogibacterium sp.]
MLQDSRIYVNEDLTSQRKMLGELKEISRRTRFSREYSLAVRKDGRLNLNYYKDGEHKQEYISKSKEKKRSRLIAAIRKYRVSEELIRRTTANIELMESFLEEYRTINPNELREALAAPYRAIDPAIFSIAGVPDLSMMPGAVHNPDSANWHPENLKQVVSNGQLVRSKSEIINTYIYDKLGIRYRYEELIMLCGKTRLADFRLISPDGTRTIWHEHFGMMSDPAYRERAIERYGEYIRSGFIPDVDVIFTYDSMDGVIDTWLIERKLLAWLRT